VHPEMSVLKDSKETEVHVDEPVVLVNPVLMVSRDPVEKRETLVIKVYKDLLVFQEPEVYQDPLD